MSRNKFHKRTVHRYRNSVTTNRSFSSVSIKDKEEFNNTLVQIGEVRK